MKNMLNELDYRCKCTSTTCPPGDVCVEHQSSNSSNVNCFCTRPHNKEPYRVNDDNKTGVTATKSIVSGQTQTTLKETVIDRLVSKVIKKLK